MIPAYSPNKSYSIGNKVSHKGKSYKAKTSVPSGIYYAPDTSPYWELISTSESTSSDSDSGSFGASFSSFDSFGSSDSGSSGGFDGGGGDCGGGGASGSD